MYLTDLKLLPELEAAIGKRVLITGNGGAVHVEAITLEQAEEVWRQQRPVKLTLPELRRTGNGVVPLAAPLGQGPSVECVGSKAANYAVIQALFGSAHVRPGYAIGFQPYLEVIQQGAETQIDTLVRSKDQLTQEETRQCLSEIRKQILRARVPYDTIHSLRVLLTQRYPRSRIRLRSSTNCEDLPRFNGAGLYESKGFNSMQNNARLARQLLEVYASLWSYEAFMEREHFQMGPTVPPPWPF